MNKSYTIIIVGLGKIGFSYDENRNEATPPRSHLISALNNPSFSEICGVEIRREARKKIKKTCADSRLHLTDHIPTHKMFDVGVISTPSEFREEVVKEILKCKIKVLIIEKPISLNLEEALRIKELVEKYDITVRVNFHRRLDEEYSRLKPIMVDKMPLLITFKYCKGILNYGMHFIDFLIDWFGEFESIMSIDGEEFVESKSLSFSCRLKNGLNVLAFGLDETDYDLFDVDIFFKQSLVSFKNGGIIKVVSHSEPDIYHDGYSHLGEAKFLSNLTLIDGLRPLYKAVIENLSNGADLPGCDITDAIYGLKVVRALERSATTGRSELVVA